MSDDQGSLAKPRFRAETHMLGFNFDKVVSNIGV